MTDALYSVRRKDRPHARVYHHWLEHPSWKELSPSAFKVIVHLMAEYRPDQPNVFGVGERRMANLIGCGKVMAKKAIDELVEGGFLRVERRGRNSGTPLGRERAVSLTRYDTETAAQDPELPIKSWQRKQKYDAA